MSPIVFRREPQKSRFLKALVVVALCVGATFAIDSWWNKEPDAVMEASSAQATISFETFMSDDSFMDMRSKLPAGFEEEALGLVAYAEVYVSKIGGVIGFISSGGAEEVYKICSEELYRKGWTRVESGQKTAASFIKSGGKFNWIFLDCISIGDEVSVVIQVN